MDFVNTVLYNTVKAFSGNGGQPVFHRPEWRIFMSKDYLTEFLPDLEEFKEKPWLFTAKRSAFPYTKAFPADSEAMRSAAGKSICSGFVWRADS